MPVDRRGFLAGLLGAAAVPLLAKLPTLPTWPTPVPPSPQALAFRPDTFALASEQLDFAEVYRALLIDAKELFLERRAHAGWPVQPGDVVEMSPARLGALFPDGLLVTRQATVVVRQSDVTASGDHARERVLLAAIDSLSGRTCGDGMDRFALLMLPRGADYAGIAGPIRMVVAYDVYVGELVAVFDVLGGSSLAARRHVQQDLSAQIKQRLLARRAGVPIRRLPLPA